MAATPVESGKRIEQVELRVNPDDGSRVLTMQVGIWTGTGWQRAVVSTPWGPEDTAEEAYNVAVSDLNDLTALADPTLP